MQEDVTFTVTLTQMTWFLLVLWFDITHAHTHAHAHAHTRTQIYRQHTGTNRLTHKCVLTPPIKCLRQLYVLNWINHSMISKFYFTEVNNIFTSKIIFLHKSHICWLDSVRLSPWYWNTNNTDWSQVNEQKTNTHHTEKKMALERDSWCVNKWYPLF